MQVENFHFRPKDNFREESVVFFLLELLHLDVVLVAWIINHFRHFIASFNSGLFDSLVVNF